MTITEFTEKVFEKYPLSPSETSDFNSLSKGTARYELERLLARNRILKDPFLFVSMCGYNDLGLFHTAEINKIFSFTKLESRPIRRLWFWSRGFFKTSLITEAHTLWLIVHNPNIRILIVSYSLEVAKKPLGAIRNQFITNELFRHFFREFCPKPNKENKIEWGTSEALTIPNRPRSFKEPTVMCAGVGTNITGLHFDCLLPNTEVLTSNGWLKIKDVRVGNRLLTLDGSFKNITNVTKKQSDKSIVKIHPSYFSSPSEFTDDHKIFIFDGRQFMWVEAKDIKPTDFLVVPRIKSNNGGLSKTNKRINDLLKKKDIWRLIGYWLAEGAATEGNSVRLTFAQKEVNYIEDVRQIVKTYLGRDITVSDTKSNTSVVFFTDVDFKTIVNTLGTHSYNKHIPPFFLNNNSVRQKELVLGYFRGDGCITERGVCFTSVSKDLLTGIQLLLAKWGIHSSVRKDCDGGVWEICGVRCNTRTKYSLRSSSPLANILLGGKSILSTNSKTFFTDKYWCIPIRTIEKRTEQSPFDVYDITVNSEHNFFCQGIIAHNCQKIDDLVNKDSVTNETQVQSSKDYYSLLRPIFDNPTMPREDIIGTIYHFNDLHSNLLENQEFEKSIIPAHDGDGRFIFPERLNQEGFENLCNDPNIGPDVINNQWMLRPVDPSKAKFKESWIKYYDEVPDVAEYICVDPASTQKKKSDYTVIERWGVDSDGNHYLLEAIRDKLTSFQRIDRLFTIVKNSKNLKWVNYEVLGGRHGDLEVIKERQAREQLFFMVKETKATTAAKEDRITQRLQGPYNAGVVYLPRTLSYKSEFDSRVHDFIQEMKLEILQFPFTEHDDILDCQSQMFQEELVRGKRTKIKEKKVWGTADDYEKLYKDLKSGRATNPYLTDERIRSNLLVKRFKKIVRNQ